MSDPHIIDDVWIRIELRNLAAFRNKSGEQKFVTTDELRQIINQRSNLRWLREGRASCNCCGEPTDAVFDISWLHICQACAHPVIDSLTHGAQNGRS